ncbi:MAG TPA: hypothetical protein DCY17_02695 [Clostridiales bacterium]|nr:hypothetical protein [Clostridiales bacterium]
MHAAEPTAKRRKQNRVSIKTGVRTRFFLLPFPVHTAVPKIFERKSNNSTTDRNPFGNNYAHLRRRYGYEEKRKV